MTTPIRVAAVSMNLTPDEARTWRAVAALAQVLLGNVDRDLSGRSGLPLSYREVLAYLEQAPRGSARMSELAAGVRMSRCRLSHAVRRMEECGWIRRVKAPGDGRGHVAVLTFAGTTLRRRAALAYAASVRGHLLDLLTADEADQLRHISESVLERAMRQAERPREEADHGRS